MSTVPPWACRETSWRPERHPATTRVSDLPRWLHRLTGLLTAQVAKSPKVALSRRASAAQEHRSPTARLCVGPMWVGFRHDRGGDPRCPPPGGALGTSDVAGSVRTSFVPKPLSVWSPRPTSDRTILSSRLAPALALSHLRLPGEGSTYSGPSPSDGRLTSCAVSSMIRACLSSGRT